MIKGFFEILRMVLGLAAGAWMVRAAATQSLEFCAPHIIIVSYGTYNALYCMLFLCARAEKNNDKE